MQQPVCIVLALRRSAEKGDLPAPVRFRSLAEGPREAKFAELATITLDHGWTDALAEWRAPFLPAGEAEWIGYPGLEDLFEYNGTGVMIGRTWIAAPDPQSLGMRWDSLKSEPDPATRASLFHPHLRDGKPGDKHIEKAVSSQLGPEEYRTYSVAKDDASVVKPLRFGFRSFDRQWIIPDARLINQPNPNL